MAKLEKGLSRYKFYPKFYPAEKILSFAWLRSGRTLAVIMEKSPRSLILQNSLKVTYSIISGNAVTASRTAEFLMSKSRPKYMGTGALQDPQRQERKVRADMSIYKRGGVYWFNFRYNDQHIQASTRQGNAQVARTAEAATRLSW
jgi:hypothetical protein